MRTGNGNETEIYKILVLIAKKPAAPKLELCMKLSLQKVLFNDDAKLLSIKHRVSTKRSYILKQI